MFRYCTFSTKTNHPDLTRPISNPQNPFSAPKFWSPGGDGACGHDVCTEGEVKEAALAMRQNGMQALGYSYLNMDDCWEATNRTSDGHITWDASRFPSGIPALTSWLHERGFKLGIYTSASASACGGNWGSRGHEAVDAKAFAEWGIDWVKVRTPHGERKRARASER